MSTGEWFRTDPTVVGCLDKIRRGDISAVGILADYLDEYGLPLAGKVRDLWDRYQRNEAYYLGPNAKIRRQISRWEEIALWRQFVRRRVAKMFGRKWKRLKLNKLYSRPVVRDE